MTNTHRLAAIVTGAAVIGLLLVGCTTPSPSPSTSTKLPTPSSTPTSTAFEPSGDPGKAQPPKDAQAAYAAANKTIGDFLHVRSQILSDGGLNPDRIQPFADGGALTQVKTEASQAQEQKVKIFGVPSWEPDASSFSTGTATIGSAAVENGAAYVKGCFDISNQTFESATNPNPPTPKVKRFPAQFSVYYVATSKSWKVWELDNLTGKEGAPAC